MPKAPFTNYATKADIRADFQAHPEKYAGLSEKEQHSIVSRGQVSGAAIKVFNRGKKAHRKYVPGQGAVAKKQRLDARKDLIARGLAGKRGPLSQKAVDALVKG